MEFFIQLSPGTGTFFVVEPVIAMTRTVLIVFGLVLACLGLERTLEPLIMVSIGTDTMTMNCGMMFLTSGTVGNPLPDLLVSDTSATVDAIQVNFLQPIYNLTFSDGPIACLVFMDTGARSEINFLLAKSWNSMATVTFAEMGTFAVPAAGVLASGLMPEQPIVMVMIGGTDGPAVLSSPLVMAPELSVPTSIIAYLYLSLTYSEHSYVIELVASEKHRGIDMYVEVPKISRRSKFPPIITACTILYLLLSIATPLLLSFLAGMTAKEAKINKHTELFEEGLSYFGTFSLGLILGVSRKASTILNPIVIITLVIGTFALAIFVVDDLLGDWSMYLVYRIRREDFNPIIGIAGVSYVSTTARLAQHAAQDENPPAAIPSVTMGANISSVITSAITASTFITTISMV